MSDNSFRLKLWLSGRSSDIKQCVFFMLEPWFCHCCTIIWKLLSGMWVILLNERECFPAVLMWWKQSSKHFAFGWIENLQTTNNKNWSYLNHDFVTAVKLLWKLICSVWVHINLKKEWFLIVLVCWLQLSNHFFFWLNGKFSTKECVFFRLETWFCHCCKVIWKLVSGVWVQGN